MLWLQFSLFPFSKIQSRELRQLKQIDQLNVSYKSKLIMIIHEFQCNNSNLYTEDVDSFHVTQ